MANRKPKKQQKIKTPRPQMPKMPGMKKPSKGSWFFYLLLGLLAVGIIYSLFPPIEEAEQKSFTEVVRLIQDDRVEELVISGDVVRAKLTDGTEVESRRDPFEGLTEAFVNLGVDPSETKITYEDPQKNTLLKDLLLTFGPVLLIVFIFMMIFRQARGAGADVFSFGKSRARLFSKDTPRVKFDDVGGADEAKKELMEVVDFLKNPQKYRKLGARIPKGVLLVGPAGTGKTLLARAVAGQANVPFFSIAGSEFMEMLVGVGASRVRDMFQTAKNNAPALIFIDELESIGRQRGYGVGGGHDEREQTLNQILVEMDGFEVNTNVIVLAATNRPDLLDPALVRAGRFDRRIVVGLPDIEGRQGILKIHMQGKPFAKEVQVESLARRTVGFSGADLENMLNEAAILAARDGKKEIDEHDLEEAATKVKLGPEKKRMQTEKARRMTAYHEAGHAVVMHNLPTADPVQTVSIISRGMALGFTLAPPKTDRYNETKQRLTEMIVSFMGGRAAEQVVFNEQTIGASDDFDKATQLAKRMVMEYGMSSLGPLSLKSYVDEASAWGYFTRGSEARISDELLSEADKEVRRMVEEAYEKAVVILKENHAKLDEIAEYLLEHETLREDTFTEIMGPKEHVEGEQKTGGVVIAPHTPPDETVEK